MEWQEAIFALGSCTFMLALIPSIIERKPPALSTSVTTGVTLALFSVAYMTMGFWYAGVASLITAVMWAMLAYQRIG
jgi:hypothetical protein